MAGTVVKGTLSIEVDGLELEARLAFSPDKDGPEHDADAALRLMGERRLSPLPSAKGVEELLQKFAKSKEATSAPVARGVAPEQPVPEKVAWADLPVPDDLAELARDRVERAGPPELYRLRVEKTKRETIVKKPGPLPFLPPKEEVVVTWDKREFKEAVQADPTVKDALYVLKGAKAGTVQPPKPGKPGKNVYGKAVQPSMDADPAFLLGKGLVRDKSELRAAYSGVLRIGEGWADVVPLAKPDWKVEKGVDGATVYLRYEPGDPSLARPLPADVVAAATALGALEADLVGQAEVEAALERSTRSGEALEAFPLSRRAEAEARVDVSPDGLEARLFLRKGVAGAPPLELKAVAEAIKASRVRGFAAEQVKADILAFFKGPAVELADYVLARGTAPVRGKDREVQPSISFMPPEEREKALGRIAAHPRFGPTVEGFAVLSATDAAFVAAGTRVAVLSKPAAGTGGRDVYGADLPGLPGNDPRMSLLAGLRMHGDEIVAEASGLLLVRRDGAESEALVLEYADAAAAVAVSEDGMSATIALEKEKGAGRPLSLEFAAEALAAAGAVRGVDKAALAAAVARAQEAGSCAPVEVARGEHPVAGGGVALKWLKELKPGAGGVRAAAVAAGEAVAEISRQGDEGRPGFDVTGRLLDPAASPAAAPAPAHDESLREEKAGAAVRLVAAVSGELRFDGWKASVEALRVVKGDVSAATGNVSFPGEVRVAGGIGPGFAVVGGGDVLVQQAAEAALVSAGGRAVVGQGVIGSGKGVVRARKGIDAGFAEQATLLAVEDIRLKNGCVQCQVKTNGKLRLLGERGHLVGGQCRARLGVEAVNVGSERGTRTDVSFGQDYLVKDQIEVAERDLEKIKAALAELDRRIKAMGGAGASLDAARAEKVRLMKLMEKHGLRLFSLREKFEEHHPSEVLVRGSVFPGVILESHGRYYEVKQARSRVAFRFDRESGRIQEKPLP